MKRAAAAGLVAALSAGHLAAATLEGFASLPANTLAPGPPAGHHIEATEGVSLPFEGQPAQGYSAILAQPDGSFLALTDNGFGSRENSSDFLLRVYCIDADFRTAEGGSGEIRINGFMNLRNDRPFTGSDFDPESMQRAPDGTFWIGEEFGPWLLHFSADGELMEQPFGLTGLVSASRAGGEESATLPPSRGFEGLAMSPSGTRLHPMLEGSLYEQPGQLNIYTFDLETLVYLDTSASSPSYRYRMEPQGTAIGAFQLFSEAAGLVLERDSHEGELARHKKVYRVDFSRPDGEGFIAKEEWADLLAIDDPHDLDRDGSTVFTFPFDTPEGLLVIDRDTIGVINDNNFPFGRGRGESRGPEDTEFILLRVAPLW